MKAAVFDLDGTLLEDNDEKARKGVKNLLKLVSAARDFKPIILTARTEEIREDTEKTLEELQLPYERLYMRPDSRIDEPDHVFKSGILQELRENGLEVEFAVEDKETVREMWEENNVTCLGIPEKHSLEHRVTDKLRKLFPYLPGKLRKIYLGLYKRRFSS